MPKRISNKQKKYKTPINGKIQTVSYIILRETNISGRLHCLIKKHAEKEIIKHSKLNCNFSLLCNLKIGYGSLKKVQINLASCSPCTTFAASEGRNPRSRMRFLLYSAK